MVDINFNTFINFSCPYSFVLTELLAVSNLNQRIQFNFVESPLLNTCELEDAYYTIKHQYPHSCLQIPSLLPKPSLAIAIFAKTLIYFPDKAISLADSIYHSLWIEDEDISQVTVLEAICKPLGLAHIVNVPCDPDVQSKCQQWHSEWLHTYFAEPIPFIVRHDRQQLLGLPSKDKLLRFFN